MAQEYPFVEEPSQDFYCPVTYDVMVEPHLTSCCGKNLSERAVFRIQREGNPCPLCRGSNWSTLLNKELQDMVGALRVFCPHVDRGCKWKGKLRQFDSHVEHCSKGDAPVQESTRYNLWTNTLCTYSVHNRETVLHDAAKRGDAETVQRLLSAGNVDINSTNAIVSPSIHVLCRMSSNYTCRQERQLCTSAPREVMLKLFVCWSRRVLTLILLTKYVTVYVMYV